MTTKKLTKTQERILATMRELVDQGSWAKVPTPYGFTIRYTITRQTPEAVLCSQEEHARNPFGRWPEPEYQAMVFVTLTLGGVVMRVAPAPWVGARDTEIPFWLAEAVLADPELAFDTERQRAMRSARHHPRSRS